MREDVAIEDAYRAFSGYRIGRDLDFAARVGASGAEHERLRAALTETPLRALPFEAMDAYLDYIDAAHYDGGFRQDEFRYFLPRILEMLVTKAKRAGAADMAESLQRILERARVRETWPGAEVAAIDAVLAEDAGAF